MALLKFNDFLVEDAPDLVDTPIVESEEQLTEATKKEILDYMGKAEWDTNDAYLFGKQAKAHGVFKTELAASKAFSKYFDEYNKGTKFSATKARFKGGNPGGGIEILPYENYMKGGSKGISAAHDASQSAGKATPAAKAATPAAAPKKVAGLKVNGNFGSIVGSGEMYKAIDGILPMLANNGPIYKAIENYLDNLYAYRESQGAKPSNAETRHVGEAKVALTTLRHHLVELSKQSGLSYKV